MVWLSALMTACVYLPRTTTSYNEDCKIETRSMTLEPYQIASIGRCSNQDCAAILVAAGVVGAASAVVSGSVVVTGNVVYWLEEKGQCLKQSVKRP